MERKQNRAGTELNDAKLLVPKQVKSEGKTQAGATGQCILLVDDDRVLSDILRAILEQEGYNVILANCVIAAMQAMRQQLPDLVILDIVLPGTSGFTFCQQLKADATTKNIPVLLVSGRRWKQLWQSGADEFLSKPFDPVKLLAAVRRLLAKEI